MPDEKLQPLSENEVERMVTFGSIFLVLVLIALFFSCARTQRAMARKEAEAVQQSEKSGKEAGGTKTQVTRTPK